MRGITLRPVRRELFSARNASGSTCHPPRERIASSSVKSTTTPQQRRAIFSSRETHSPLTLSRAHRQPRPGYSPACLDSHLGSISTTKRLYTRAYSTTVNAKRFESLENENENKHKTENDEDISSVLAEYYGHTELTILSAALSHVPRLGFTHEALVQGAQETGHLAATASNLFPHGGPFDLILYHLVTQRLSLKTSLQFPPPAPTTTSSGANNASSSNSNSSRNSNQTANTQERLRSLIIARLHANDAIAQHMPAALALMTLPRHVAASLKELALLADEMLHLAGDTSLDSSWYTKRAAVSAVYAAAEAFHVQDASPAFIETDRFVERRLHDADALGRAAADTTQWLRYTGVSMVNVLRSWGVRI